MNPFHSVREAEEFLISRIVEEAQREGIVLSETERKMLYFSETAWTLPDMDTVSDEFDSAYNQRDYEKKIAFARLANAFVKTLPQSTTIGYGPFVGWSQKITIFL